VRPEVGTVADTADRDRVETSRSDRENHQA
jgi:hypothetical protein